MFKIGAIERNLILNCVDSGCQNVIPPHTHI
jgi:hypothetical protein